MKNPLSYFRRAIPDRKPSDDPGNPAATRTGQVVVITYDEFISAAAALKHPVVSRCVDIIAKAVQSVRWFAEEDPDATADERSGNKTRISALNSLLRSPNDRMTGPNFRYWMAQNYALMHRVPFLVSQGTTGNANGLYPLNAAITVAIANNRGLLEKFEYGNGEEKRTYPIRRNAGNGAAYVYEIARPTLEGTPVGWNGLNKNSLLCSVALPAQVITLLLRRAIDTASGHPNSKYVITAEKTLTEKQKTALKEHLADMEPGGEESGNILFLSSTDAKITKLDNDLSDIHSKVPLDDMTRMIAGAFGVPIALVGLGAADAAKFAGNYSESRRAFWADTIVPGYLEPFAAGMTQAICPQGVRIRFDLDGIDALRDHNIANAKNLEGVSFLSIDEKRELVGFEPIGTQEATAVPSPSSKPAASPAPTSGE